MLSVERIFGEPNLSGIQISQILWRPDSQLFSYLRSTSNTEELWAFDITAGRRTRLLDFSKFAQPQPARLSRPHLRHRRFSLPPPPAVACQWSPVGDQMLLADGDSLYLFRPDTGALKSLPCGDGPVEDPKFSPDGRCVSFVRNYDLYLLQLASGQTMALTQGGSEECRNATADSLYSPGVSGNTAYRWSPDSSRIAFLQFEERGVTQYPLLDYLQPSGSISWQRYPLPGGRIQTVKVGVVEIPDRGGVPTPRWMEIAGDQESYLAQVNWLPDSRRLALQKLNRQQNKLDLSVCDVATSQAQHVLSEEDPAWINLNSLLQFFADGENFLWSAERGKGKFRHLYVYGLDGRERAQLTSGPWAAVGVSGFDEKNRAVYFVSFRRSWLEGRLERVRFQMDEQPLRIQPGAVEDLTPEPGTHMTTLSPDCAYFADLFSTVSTPNRLDLYRTDGSCVATVEENPVPALSKYRRSRVEFFQIPAARFGDPATDGIPLDAKLIKPPDFRRGRKYPVIVYVYGGPVPADETGLMRFVVNLWRPTPDLWFQVMAQKAYVIFCLDNRGANASPRGHAFELPIWKRLGEVELADQLAGVKYLKSLPFVDPARIGIFGGSFGGFMTLKALLTKPAVFKAGVAYAPVTDWSEYNAEFTEQYMQLPAQNEKGYKQCSPVHSAGRLRSKLLLIHGTEDDNVYPQHSLQMADALIEAGKEFELFLYPRADHTNVFFGVGDHGSVVDFYRRVTQFFLDNL